ncbi:hypothetical protein [Synechocystis salina]|uniref:DUF5648 domain-containing protein n=1 Tax=Synechocystis salina LEGE 00031 TaxID=1828736 RepID=A0ABR9VTE7_9SYNC|nr:hypothetical protein [Synechocystis salina]MBE9241810.1 hypothetical protein [Synechocystis salina LEGE 00041]MBE9253506.1 hypothetical protein [Synechocystis salina LEGE 00031]
MTVNYTIQGTADATDYTGATPGSGKNITFDPGSSIAYLFIDPTADSNFESDETVAITLASGTGYEIGTIDIVVGTISNDGVEVLSPPVESPSITLTVSPNSVTEDGTDNLVYTFTRTGDTTKDLTVNYSIAGTADSSDFTGATPGIDKAITFTADSSTATLTIDPTADTVVEPNQTVIVTLASGTSYTVGTTGAVTGTITNDDTFKDNLTGGLVRFRNNDRPGTYLFAGAEEAANIRQNFKNFVEEGAAFQVATTKTDPLLQTFYRFQNTAPGREGTYLFAGEGEATSIRQNFKNFVEEGIAFYAYSAGVGEGTTEFSRFQSKTFPGTYLFAGPGESAAILNNPGFTYEGTAFAAGG